MEFKSISFRSWHCYVSHTCQTYIVFALEFDHWRPRNVFCRTVPTRRSHWLYSQRLCSNCRLMWRELRANVNHHKSWAVRWIRFFAKFYFWWCDRINVQQQFDNEDQALHIVALESWGIMWDNKTLSKHQDVKYRTPCSSCETYSWSGQGVIYMDEREI